MVRLVCATDVELVGTHADERSASSESVARDLERSKRNLFVAIPSKTVTATFVITPGVCSESAGLWEVAERRHGPPNPHDANVEAWASLDKASRCGAGPPGRIKRATDSTSTTGSSGAEVLRRLRRDAGIRRMSPEARATYDRILKLRDEIGPVDFDVVKALRELRDDE